MRELEGLTVTNPENLWIEVVNKLDLNLGVCLPVQMFDPGENIRLGSFHASFVNDEGKIYLQLEDFDSPEWADEFFKVYEGDWEICVGGIYRMRLDSLHKANTSTDGF